MYLKVNNLRFLSLSLHGFVSRYAGMPLPKEILAFGRRGETFGAIQVSAQLAQFVEGLRIHDPWHAREQRHPRVVVFARPGSICDFIQASISLPTNGHRWFILSSLVISGCLSTTAGPGTFVVQVIGPNTHS